MSAHIEVLYAPETSVTVVPGTTIAGGEELCSLPGTIGVYLSTDDSTVLTGTPNEVLALLNKTIMKVIRYQAAHPELDR